MAWDILMNKKIIGMAHQDVLHKTYAAVIAAQLLKVYNQVFFR
jgi:hypothetical protein